jgi:hypothetical protein
VYVITDALPLVSNKSLLELPEAAVAW